MSLINISNLTFSYDGSYDNVFENVSFQLDTDWKLGLIGRNGRGKTTLCNLLMKKYDYKGSISSSVEFDCFPFEVKDKTVNTIDIAELIYPNYVYWELSRELSLLDVDDEVLYRPFATLSNGEQTKVMLAILFLKENNFLLIDEPTNHLDLTGRKTVSNYLKGKKGFILISHDRAFLDGCIDHVMSINKTYIDIQKGNFSSWQINKEHQDNFELSKNEKLKKEIKRLEKTAKEKASWSDKVEKTKTGTTEKVDKGYIGHKSAKMMQSAKNIEKRQNAAIEEKSELLKNIEQTDNLKISPLKYHAKRLLSLNNVSVSYKDKTVCKNINFEINRGDRIALVGKNGSGKSSIIKLICGEDIPYSGQVQIGSRLIISYVSQNTAMLSGSLSDYARQKNIDESLFKAVLRKMDFSRLQFEKDISDFSGGQKKKVLIAGSLCEKAHLYIWDEPLNYIDVMSRIQIEDLLIEFEPTILFVEHDESFCNKIATKTVNI